MVNPFEERLKSRGSESNPFAKRQKERLSEDTRTLEEQIKGAGAQYATGYGGGFGGAAGDVNNLYKELPGAGTFYGPRIPGKIEGTHELTDKIAKDFDVEDPKGSLERILRTSGQWGGQEGAIGTALGGPAGGGAGTVHGSISGALYESLKEAGMPDEWALGTTMLFTISPIAFQKLLPKIEAKLASKAKPKNAEKAIEALEEGKKPGAPPDQPPLDASGAPPEGPPPGAAGFPPEEVARDIEPQYAPEEQKITAPQQFLKSDYELAEDIQNTLSPLRQEGLTPERVPPVTINRTFAPVRDELQSVSPHRVNNPNLIGGETSRAVKRVSNELYRENSRLWSVAEDMASQEIFERPELAESLRSIIEESPARPVAGEAKLQNFAEDLLERLERRRGQRVSHTAMSNEQLIKEIKQARAGYDYRYSGGVQGHRVNEFINAVEQELIRTSSDESRNALLRARDAHRTWASTFKDPSILPFRNERLGKPQALYNRMTSPDTYNILNEILSNDPSGRGPHLLKLAARNMLEKAIEPYLMRPKSFNPMKFERDMAKLQGIIPEEVNQSIGQKLYQLHEESLNQPARIEGPKEPSFARISEREIPGKLRTLEGLRQLKKELAQVPGGAEKYKEIAGTMGIDLLFGGQMDVPANSDRIRRMINDRNGRPYIKETLGEDNLHALDELVKKNSLEKRLLEIKESPTLSQMIRDPDILIKGSKVIWSMLKGNPITVTNQLFQLHKKISGKMKPREIGPAPSPDVTLQ